MSSILTNMSAMSAVASLTATQKALSTTENQISTGLKVSTAEDNASYWSIATSMRSDVSALSAVTDSLNLGNSVVATAMGAVSQSIDILNQMKQKILTAQTAGQDKTTIDTQLLQLQDQLRTYSNTATFNGVNLLATTQTGVNVVTSFSKDSNGLTSVGLTDISLTTPLYSGVSSQGSFGDGILDTTGASYTLPDGTSVSTGFSIDNLQTTQLDADGLLAAQDQIEAAISALTTANSTLGSLASNLTSQLTFTQTLSDSLTSGVGSLVDADMNEASTRLNALQTQQQLGIQSLSIANSNTQLILKLFQ
jgi:flagellin